MGIYLVKYLQDKTFYIQPSLQAKITSEHLKTGNLGLDLWTNSLKKRNKVKIWTYCIYGLGKWLP